MARYLLLGMIAGLLAAVLAFGVARVWGEPPVAAAIALEEAATETGAETGSHGHDPATPTHSHGEDEEGGISRQTQAGIGLFTGMAVFGAGLGGLFALAFALVQDRLSHLTARGTAAALAGCGYVALVLVPFLKYPANPPAVGHGETIGLRTQMFFAMMALSLAAMAIAALIGGRARDRWRGAVTGGLAYLVLVLAAAMALPAINEVPADFPGDLLWQFRSVSLIVSAVLWAGIGLLFGLLAERRPA
ncbi:MAG: CbtA family protein [Paracoccus sp. (in: a-proteobacteria)]|uniref:CbtA family protein n=1 Tax=Paracoccus sp. TaxID=267 RepID=UPI0039E330C7